MTLLASILPLLTNGSQMNLEVSCTDGRVRIVTIPKLRGFDEKTLDPTQASLQAALAKPLVFHVSADNPDADLATLLAQVPSLNQATHDQLAAYLETQREAQQTARAAQEKKPSPKPAAKAAGKPAVTGATTTAPAAASGGMTMADLAPDAASGDTTPVCAPQATPATIDLF